MDRGPSGPEGPSLEPPHQPCGCRAAILTRGPTEYGTGIQGLLIITETDGAWSGECSGEVMAEFDWGRVVCEVWGGAIRHIFLISDGGQPVWGWGKIKGW